jgi:hypothetical protein
MSDIKIESAGVSRNVAYAPTGKHYVPKVDVIEHTFEPECACGPSSQVWNGVTNFYHREDPALQAAREGAEIRALVARGMRLD